MATMKQVAANRENAAKSTGPKTAEGKAACRGNGLKHGLAARLLVPEHDRAAAEARTRSWTASLNPANASEEWVVKTMAVDSLRVDRCFEHESQARAKLASRAELHWDEDRELEAEVLGRKLAADPALIRLKLEQTPHGCGWLVGHWKEWIEAVSAAGACDDAHKLQAMNLLGIDLKKRDREIQDWSVEVAEEEVARLQSKIRHVVGPMDAVEREMVEAGLGEDREVRLVRRYEAAAMRRIQLGRDELNASRRERSGPSSLGASTPPQPAAKPVETPKKEVGQKPISAPKEPSRPEPFDAQTMPSKGEVIEKMVEMMLASEGKGTIRRSDVGREPVLNRRARRAAEKLARKRGKTMAK